MKTKILAIIATVLMSLNSGMAQSTIFGREVTVGGEIRVGTPFFQLFGSRFGESDFSLWTQLDVTDTKSGFGFSVYHLGDFNFNTPTNFWGVDVVKSWQIGEKYSMLALLEYAYFDNFPDMQGFAPAVIVNRKGWVDAEISLCYVYFLRQITNQHQQTIKLELSKEVLSGLSFRIDGWYDNLYQDHWFGAVGATVDLTQGFAFKVDGLIKNNTIRPIFRIVKHF
jgi:hypothetical protein